MSIIRSHEVTLYGGNDVDVVLRPLSDQHLPLLYRWNADPEVLYWTEGGEDIIRSYDEALVRRIYGGVSQHALCFLVEADGASIGTCWLQNMNIEDVQAMYPPGTDVRRIDMAIGEKAYWGKGIGSAFIGMMIDYAFLGEYVDVLHCFSEDYNVRSRRMWEKHGFTLVKEELLPQPQKGRQQLHYVLTRQEFSKRRRGSVPPEKCFMAPLASLQPSQLWVSEGKMRLLKEWFDPSDPQSMDPIPIIRMEGLRQMTDGHTRVAAACLAGWKDVPVYWDESLSDTRAYAVDLRWCREEGIHSPYELTRRIVPHAEYERLWRKRCMEMVLD